jgi:hypothetical protein
MSLDCSKKIVTRLCQKVCPEWIFRVKLQIEFWRFILIFDYFESLNIWNP